MAARAIGFAFIKQQVPLTAVLARYGLLAGLKQRGGQLVGACPIHGGHHTRQFVVDPVQGLWHCFADCRRGGDLIEFVALMEGVSRPEAAALIAVWFASLVETRVLRSSNMADTGNKPTHRAYVVEQKGEGESAQSFWVKIGVAYPHADGLGMTIALSAHPIGNKIVLREWSDDEPKQPKPLP